MCIIWFLCICTWLTKCLFFFLFCTKIKRKKMENAEYSYNKEQRNTSSKLGSRPYSVINFLGFLLKKSSEKSFLIFILIHYPWKRLVSLLLIHKANFSMQLNCNGSLHQSRSFFISRKKYKRTFFIPAFQTRKVLLGGIKHKSYSKILLVCDWPCKSVCCNPVPDDFSNSVAEISWWRRKCSSLWLYPLITHP